MPSLTNDVITGVSASVAMKAPVRVATTANITRSGLQTIDGITLVADDRVLVKNQTDAEENGIYIASNSTWERAADFDGARDAVQGTLVYVVSGTASGNAFFQLTTSDPVIGTSNLTFTRSDLAFSNSSAFVQTLLDDATSNAFLTTLTSTRSEAGATAVTVLNKLREVISVKDFGAVGDGVTNDYAAIQAAIDAAEAAGKGIVLIPAGTFKINTGLTLLGTVALRGMGRDVSVLDASAVTGTPAIDVGDGTTSYLFPRVEGLWIDAPVGQPVIRVRKVSRPTFQDLYLDGFHTGIQLGSGDDDDFVSEATLRDIEGALGQTPHGHGLDIQGATGVADNVRLEGWSVANAANVTAGKAGLSFTANASQKSTDGFQIINCGFGLFDIGWKIAGACTTFVVQVANSFFDRCHTSAVDMAFPNGSTASIIKAVNNHFQGGTSLGASHGITITQSGTGSASIIQFTGNHISGFGNYGLLLQGALTKCEFVGNIITNIAVANTAAWDGVSIDNGVEGVFTGNYVDSACRYGWNIGDSLNLMVRDNPTKGFVTGATLTNTGIAGVNRVIEANGDGRKKVALFGPFSLANMPANTAEALRLFAGYLNGANTDAISTVMPGFRGFISGLRVSTSAAVTASTLTYQVTVNGVAGTLQTVQSTGTTATASQSTGDFFTATDKVGINVTSGVGFTPAGSMDIVGWLELTEY